MRMRLRGTVLLFQVHRLDQLGKAPCERRDVRQLPAMSSLSAVIGLDRLVEPLRRDRECIVIDLANQVDVSELRLRQ